MKLVHEIWQENFSENINFQNFLSIVPQLSAVITLTQGLVCTA